MGKQKQQAPLLDVQEHKEYIELTLMLGCKVDFLKEMEKCLCRTSYSAKDVLPWRPCRLASNWLWRWHSLSDGWKFAIAVCRAGIQDHSEPSAWRRFFLSH